MKSKIKNKRLEKPAIKMKWQKELIAILLLCPVLASMVLFKYFPILLGFFESFFKMNVTSLPGKFVGFDNYIRAFSDKNFLMSFGHNAKMFVYSMVMNFWVPIVLAMLIDETRKGRTFFRLVYFIPACTPAIAMTVLWKYFWQPDYGLANYFMKLMHLPEQLWLNSESLVYFCMYFPGLIISGGMNMVIYLAALQDVPGELYEAALIDGAGIRQRIRYVTIPGIKHIVMLMLTLTIIGSFNIMENVLLLTGGGPSNSTQTMLLYAYQQATNSMDYSYAITMIGIVFIATMILTIIFNKITTEKE